MFKLNEYGRPISKDKMKAKFLISLFLSLWGSSIWAYEEVIDGIAYNFNDNKAYVSRGIDYSGDIIIPNDITYLDQTYIVSGIEYRAFYECNGLTSVVIPDGVEKIEESAFYNCM